jgi:hypothetical protein
VAIKRKKIKNEKKGTKGKSLNPFQIKILLLFVFRVPTLIKKKSPKTLDITIVIPYEEFQVKRFPSYP